MRASDHTLDTCDIDLRYFQQRPPCADGQDIACLGRPVEVERLKDGVNCSEGNKGGATHNGRSALKVLELLPHAIEDSPSIDANHEIPITIGRLRDDRGHTRGSCDIRTAVDSAQLADGLFDPLLDLKAISDVHDTGNMLGAFQLFQCLVEAFLVQVRDREDRAPFRQQLCSLEPNAAGTTSQHYLESNQ